MKKIKILCICIFVFVINSSYSIANDQKLQVDKISKNLRCLICQGQSVYDSQSDFAESLKILINQKNIVFFIIHKIMNLKISVTLTSI